MTTHQTEVDEIVAIERATLEAIARGNRKRVISLFRKAEKIFSKGTEYTRDVVSNHFLFPLSQMLSLPHANGSEYLTLLPTQLRAEYCRQINARGI